MRSPSARPRGIVQPLDWFFADWVENDRVVREEVESVDALPDGTVEVAVKQTGTARLPVVCEVTCEDGSRGRAVAARDAERHVVRVPGAGAVRLVRLDPDHRLALYDPQHKSFYGRPWVAARREGAALIVRNESRQEREVQAIVHQAKGRSEITQLVAAGAETTIAIPESGAQVQLWDLTDHFMATVTEIH
jgi:hypothetical protein